MDIKKARDWFRLYITKHRYKDTVKNLSDYQILKTKETGSEILGKALKTS